MKNLFYFLLFAISTYSTKAQQFVVLKGSIITNDTVVVEVYKPVNGFFNFVSFKSENCPSISKTINNTITFQDSIQIKTAGYVRVVFTSSNDNFLTKFDILLFPNDTVNFQYNTMDSSIKFNGSNAKGHELFYTLTNEPARISIPADDILGMFPDNRNTFVNELIKYGNTLCDSFEKLLNQGLITSQYYQIIEDNLHVWPINLAVATLLFSTKKGAIIKQQTIDSIIEDIYIIYPPIDKYHALLNTTSYFNDFLAFSAYKKHHLISPKQLYSADTVIYQNGKQINLDKEFVRFLFIEDPNIRQNEWGFFLTSLFSFTRGVFDLSNIEQYEELNPKNNWSKILRQQYAEIIPEKIESFKLSSPIVFIKDNDHVNTFAELIQRLPKSDFYFVDVWSSWCGPCIKAFRANPYLDSVLQVNQITKLYFSIDKNMVVWKTAVNKYALGGYNIMANESLIIDLKAILGININSTYSIPRYLLINEKGQLVKELLSPTTRSGLAYQIKELVKKNK
jgi:thiol-disulfide isomerase/thioredoxin